MNELISSGANITELLFRTRKINNIDKMFSSFLSTSILNHAKILAAMRSLSLMPPLTPRRMPKKKKTKILKKLVSFITSKNGFRKLIHNTDKPSGKVETNVFGCWLMRFRMTSNIFVFPTLTDENGKKRRRNEKKKNPNLKQSVHRLSLRIWKTKEDLHLLFMNGFEVSHCHNIKCYNPSHLTIESRTGNESRKNCGIRRRWVCGLLSMASGESFSWWMDLWAKTWSMAHEWRFVYNVYNDVMQSLYFQ